MLGKGAVISVIGFAIAFSVYQTKMSRAVVSAFDSFNRQYAEARLAHAKLSAMNMGINKAWDEDWLNGNFDLIVEECSTHVVISPVGMDTVKLKVKAWSHIFDEVTHFKNQKSLRLEDSVTAFFKYRSPVSEFFWFTNNEGNVYWTSADTVWGPLHTNGLLRVSGSPTFYGKVTAQQGITPNPSSPLSQANYFGGWEIGIQNTLVTDMSPLLNAANTGNGAAPMNSKSLYDKEVTFEFLPDGKVIRTIESDPPDTLLLTAIAPTGVIYSTQDVHVKGTINGELTIYTTKDIWIEDNVLYADNPLVNNASDDLLGLVANNNIIIADNPANNSDVVINGSLMAVNGMMYAENYQTRPVAGSLTIVGSIYQNTRGPIATFNWGTNAILSGFEKNYRFDLRLQGVTPPYFPYVRNLQLIAWWE